MKKLTSFNVFTRYEANFSEIVTCFDFIGDMSDNITYNTNIINVKMLNYCIGFVRLKF